MSLQIQLKKSAVSQKQPFASDLAVGELALNYNADGPFLTCKDSAGNVRKLNHVWVGATAPTSPSAGDQWLDTSAATAVLKVYKNSSSTWVNATNIPIATTSIYGTVQLATAADVTNGTAGKIVDAAQLQSAITNELSAGTLTFNNVDLTGDLVVAGDLTVSGTTTTIDTETLIVEDKNIEMGVVATPSDATADGGGITLKGSTDKTLNWVDATDSWTSSENVDLASGKSYRINNTEVLNSTTLGSGVVSSSLTSVGTIGTGTWNGTTVATGFGGTGQTTYTDGQLLIGKTDGTLAKTTLTPGNGIDVTNADGSITVDVDLKANGGLVIESTELAVDLGASSITGTLATADGGTGQTTYTDGQLLIGKTDGTLAKATLSAGSNVTVTNGDGTVQISSADTTYTAGDGLDLVGTEFSADLKANGGLVVETGELAVDLGANSITGTLGPSDGGTGQTSYTDGQLLIGKTDGTLAKNTLTAGANVTITNADGAITIAAAGGTGVTSVTATSPLASSGGTTPDISIQDGTTAQKGAVQLTDSTSSTSTTTAATPNAVKSAYDLASAAVPKSLVDAKGDLLVATADDTVSRLAVGSNNQVLTADSTTGTGLKWADAGGGGAWNFISSVTASNSASVAFTSGINNTYDVYVIIGEGIVPSVDGDDLKMRYSNNGGTSYFTDSYASTNGTTFTDAEMDLTPGIGNNTGESCGITLTLYNLRNNYYKLTGTGLVRIGTTGTLNSGYSVAGLAKTNLINAVQLYMASGNISTGTFRLYGISNS